MTTKGKTKNGSNGSSGSSGFFRWRHARISVGPAAPVPRMLVTAAKAQGSYFLATGLWPLVHMPSFEAVTGPKRERWLVRTVGSVVAVVGGVLLDAARRRRVGRTAAGLGIGSAAALAGVDVAYVARRRISPVYLLDAAVELGLIGMWTAGLRAQRRSGGTAW